MSMEDLERIKHTFNTYYRKQKHKSHDENYLKRLQTTKTKLNWAISLIHAKNKRKIPISDLLKYHCTTADYWQKERRFYRFKKRMEECLADPNFPIEHLVNSVTSKETYHTKYTPEQRQKICDSFFSPRNKRNMATLWIKFRKLKSFKSISFSTFTKIIRDDKRYLKPH